MLPLGLMLEYLSFEKVDPFSEFEKGFGGRSLSTLWPYAQR
jgi:hypothetical protein